MKKSAMALAAFITAICLISGALILPGITVQADRAQCIFADEFFMTQADFSAQLPLLASELSRAENTTVRTLYSGGTNTAQTGDIAIVHDENIPPQGYRIQTGAQGALTVFAPDCDGAFYGMRSLIKAAITGVSPANGKTVTFDTAERALFLDIGRKYYSPDFIKTVIKELSFLDMNTLVLHFSEEMGLGLESRLYPWLNGRDGSLCTQEDLSDRTDNRVLKQSELKEIAQVARQYNISLVPSFDSPGHMNYIVKRFNETAAQGSFAFVSEGKTYTVPKGCDIGNYYHYDGKTAIVQGSRNTAYSRGIDISNDIAVAFTKSLIEEYAKLFSQCGSTAFDIGGDELLGWGSAAVSTSVAPRWKQLDHWKNRAIRKTGNVNAVAYDCFLLYMNDLYGFVSGMGYTSVRMWNDDALRSADTGWTGIVKLNPDIEIEYWTPTANSSKNTVKTYTDAGHGVLNYLNHFNYFVLGKASPYAGANEQSLWDKWSPEVFSPDGTDTSKNVKGCAFCVWCDSPLAMTENAVLDSIYPCLRVAAAKSRDVSINKKYPSLLAYLRTLPGRYADRLTDLPEPGEILSFEEQTTAPDPTEPEATTTPEESTIEQPTGEITTTPDTPTSPNEPTTAPGEPTTGEITTSEQPTGEITTNPDTTPTEPTTHPDTPTSPNEPTTHSDTPTSPNEPTTRPDTPTSPAEPTTYPDTPTTPSEPPFTPGDVDGDGRITVADARFCLRAAVKLDVYPRLSRTFLACDWNGDEYIGVNDARSILRKAIGLE